jgi:polyhydroxyalkanoate synthesis regulator phasin
MKTKIDANEIVTKGFLRKEFREIMDELALLINKSFQEMESRMATKEDLRELRNDLHDEIHATDTRGDVADLQCRVGKLEKKAIF